MTWNIIHKLKIQTCIQFTVRQRTAITEFVQIYAKLYSNWRSNWWIFSCFHIFINMTHLHSTYTHSCYVWNVTFFNEDRLNLSDCSESESELWTSNSFYSLMRILRMHIYVWNCTILLLFSISPLNLNDHCWHTQYGRCFVMAIT